MHTEPQQDGNIDLSITKDTDKKGRYIVPKREIVDEDIQNSVENYRSQEVLY